MSTITREFTKEQLIARAETVLSNARTAADFHNSKPYHLMDVHLAEIALASLEAEPVGEVSEQRDGLVMDGTVDLGGASTHRIIKGASKMKRLPFGTKFYTAPPAQANAEPVAWLWSHRKHPSEVSLVRPEDDERAEGAHWSGWSCQALYAAPPAPVSIPDGYRLQPISEYDAMCAAMLQGAEPVTTAYKLPFEQWLSQQNEPIDVDCGCVTTEAFNHWLRAAYEAGNSPVIPDGWVLAPVEPTAEMLQSGISAHYERSQTQIHDRPVPGPMECAYVAMLAASPQQEVKP